MAKLDILKQVQERTGTKDAFVVRDIPIGEIVVRQNVRDNDGTDIDELKASIRSVGLLQPITVYKDGDNYVCVIGHRRLRAYKELYQEEPHKYHSIKSIVTDNANVIVRQLIENVQRSDLKQIELYKALKELKSQGLNYKQIAQVIGKTEGYVKNLFSGIKEIEETPENIELIESDAVSLSDFAEVRRVKDKNAKRKLIKARAEGKLSQKQLRKVAKKVMSHDFLNELDVSKVDIPDIKIEIPDIKLDIPDIDIKIPDIKTPAINAKQAINTIITLLLNTDFTARQLHKLALLTVKEALHKAHGKEKDALIKSLHDLISKE